MKRFYGLCLMLGVTLPLPAAVMAQNAEAPPATAPVQNAEAPPAAEPTPAAKERKICRTSRVTGSLTRQNRICMTKAEWDELEASTFKGVGEMQRGAAGGQCVPRDPITRAGC